MAANLATPTAVAAQIVGPYAHCCGCVLVFAWMHRMWTNMGERVEIGALNQMTFDEKTAEMAELLATDATPMPPEPWYIPIPWMDVPGWLWWGC